MRHSQVGIFLHCIWATWDRLPLLTGEVERSAYRAIEAKCLELGAEVVALGGVQDHVHLLVQMPAMLCVADLMKHVNGASSHLIAQKIATGTFFRWQGAYAAFSVSLDHIERVRNYIAQQKEHHAQHTLVPAWEYTTEGEER